MKCLLALSLSSWVTFFISTPATAGNLSFLNNDVLSEFTEDEVISFKAKIRKSLDEVDDKSIVKWHSNTSSLNGKILPKITYNTNGISCRRTLFLLSDGKSRKSHYRFDICKVDGQWVIMDSPVAHFTKIEVAELEIILRSSLNSKTSGHPITWHNKKSGNTAVIVALSESEDTIDCRKAAISLISKQGDTSSGTYLFCKDEEMKWARKLSSH